MAALTIEEFKNYWTRNTGRTLPTNEEIYDVLNEIDQTLYPELSLAFPEKYMSEDSISVVSGTAAYNVPSDFSDIRSDGCGVVKLDADGGIEEVFPYTSPHSVQTGFWIDDANVTFTPEPAVTEARTLRYIPEFAEHNATADTLLLPSKSKRLYKKWFTKLIDIQDEEYDRATVAQQMANEAKAEIMRFYSPTPDTLKTGGASKIL